MELSISGAVVRVAPAGEVAMTAGEGATYAAPAQTANANNQARRIFAAGAQEIVLKEWVPSFWDGAEFPHELRRDAG
jgi:hypothetical protein